MSIRRLWLIGCGNMAGAMLSRWIETGALAPRDVFVLNRRDQALPAGVMQGRAFPADGLPDAVLLGIKPQQLDDIASLAPHIADVPMLISILAGVELSELARRFPARTIVRAMPNMPVAIGQGVVALHTASNDPAVRASLAALMAPLGLVEWVDPARFNAVTALAGSGPAFVYRFIDALAAAGEAIGIPADQALRLARATVAGGSIAAAGSGDAPAMLADRVASVGGSTRAGLDVLDADDALRRLLADTLAAARARNAELADQAGRAGERAQS